MIPWSPLARGVLTGNRSRDGERRTERAQQATPQRLESHQLRWILSVGLMVSSIQLMFVVLGPWLKIVKGALKL